MEILIDQDIENGVHKWAGKIEEKDWTLLCGNSVNALQSVESESVNCIITSPPYYSLRDYGIDEQIGLEDTVQEFFCRHQAYNDPGLFNCVGVART